MKTFLRHPATITALVFISLICLFFLLLPFGSKLYLTHWLTKNGADQATIEKLSFNPFNGKLTLNGVLVQTGESEPIRHDTLVVDLGLRSLIKKNVLIEQITYRDLYFEMEQNEDGSWRYGSYSYRRSDPTTKDQSAPETVQQASTTATPWAFIADKAELENCTVHFVTPALDLTITVDHAQLDQFTTRSGQPDGTLSLTGSVNDSPITLDLSSLRISPDLFFEGDIQIEGFELENLQALLQDIFPTFTGSASLDGHASFALDRAGSMLVDYDGLLSGANIDMRSEPYSNTVPEVSWQGKVQYSQGSGKPISIKTDGTLTGKSIGLQVPASNLQLSDGELSNKGTADIVIDKGVQVDTNSELTFANIQLNLGEMDFHEESVTWQGTVHYTSGTDNPLTVETEGDLNGTAIGMQIPTAQLAIPSADFNLSGTTKVVIDEFLSVDNEATLTANLPSLELAQLTVTEPQLNWQGKVHWDSESLDNFAIAGDADSIIELIEIQGDNPISVAFEELGLQGLEGEGLSSYTAAKIASRDLTATVAGTMPLELKLQQAEIGNLQLTDLKNIAAEAISLSEFEATSTIAEGAKLATFEALQLDNVTASTSPTFDTDTITFSNIAYLPARQKGDHDFLQLSSLVADAIHYDPENLSGKTIKLSDLIVDVRRNKDGSMQIAKRMADMQAQKSDGSDKTEPEAKAKETQQNQNQSPVQQAPVHLQFASIDVVGNSAIRFQDQSLASPYKTELNLKSLSITKIDSAQKDNQLELNLQGTFEKVAPFSVSGTAAPFKTEKTFNHKISLKNYPLKSLSPYTIEAVGTALGSGRLRVNTDFQLKGENIDVQNDILLQKVKTSTVDPALAAKLDKKLPVPLDAALGMMSDSQGNINLQIPVEGKLGDLDVGIGDIVVTALSKSIVSAASSYFLYALGPYGALAYVGMKVGEGLLEVKLPTVTFAPGSYDLDAKQRDYLDRIANILKDKPDTDLYITPKVSPWELYTKSEAKKHEGKSGVVDDKQQKKLEELAKQRAQSIEDYLVKSKNVAKERLLRQQLYIELDKKSKPETTIEIK